eukprot:UN11898
MLPTLIATSATLIIISPIFPSRLQLHASNMQRGQKLKPKSGRSSQLDKLPFLYSIAYSESYNRNHCSNELVLLEPKIPHKN